MCCSDLQRFANPAYLSRFPFSGLLCVAPYCAPGGIRVESTEEWLLHHTARTWHAPEACPAPRRVRHYSGTGLQRFHMKPVPFKPAQIGMSITTHWRDALSRPPI